MCGGPPGDYSAKSDCNHIYATSKLNGAIKGGSDVLVLRYFPNLIEHRDIINLACDGLGSFEELGITLCNMKINIMPVPVILFDTQGQGRFWSGIDNQISEMIGRGSTPSWIRKNIIITDNPSKCEPVLGPSPRNIGQVTYIVVKYSYHLIIILRIVIFL